MATKNSALHDRNGFVRTETVAYQLGGINNQITDDFGADNDLEVKGGGRGWTATTTRNGVVHSAKGTSKVDAAEALYGEVKRVAALEADLTSDDMTDAEFEQCVAECVTSIRPFCECKCGGQNHGAATGMTSPTLLGPKPCKCGCGQTTNRQFVPGHDARYHGLVALRGWANLQFRGREQGESEADYLDAARKAKAAAMRKAARDRRAAKRSEVKAKAEAVAKTVAPKQTKTRKAKAAPKTQRVSIDNVGTEGPESLKSLLRLDVRHDDDLPF